MTRPRRIGAVMAILLAASMPALIACTPASVESAPDPRAWAPIKCESCTRAGVTVETRRSVDENGRAGRYVFARVSNLNDHPIVFDLNLRSSGPPTGDPDFLTRGWRLTLAAAGASTAATTLTLDFSDVVTAAVSGLERF
ncbi:MAG TPA: hypothetical protein VIP11_22280 [Gemmatimonadaceae bacterium]